MSYYDDNIMGLRVGSIIAGFEVSSTPVTKNIKKKYCTVNVLSGTAWVNPLGIATPEDSIELTGAIDIYIEDGLSLVSVDGARVQIMVWK